MSRAILNSATSMLRVNGSTYRIARQLSGVYDVIRILDDLHIGQFYFGPPLEVASTVLALADLRTIAVAALHRAQTRWPVCPATR